MAIKLSFMLLLNCNDWNVFERLSCIGATNPVDGGKVDCLGKVESLVKSGVICSWECYDELPRVLQHFEIIDACARWTFIEVYSNVRTFENIHENLQ